jgi:hypothetical protein
MSHMQEQASAYNLPMQGRLLSPEQEAQMIEE